jgi:indole-3-glycerol phosphate synthase
VALRRGRRSLREIERAAAEAPPPRGFAAALAQSPHGIGLVAELKQASPSAGILRQDFDVGALAAAYARGGATCLSVLTDAPFFQGHLGNLQIAAEPGLPCLQKDFLLDEYQVMEGRAAGADAVLLIAEALPPERRLALAMLGLDLGMDVVCEAHDLERVRSVASLAERAPDRIVVGVNNRDLRNFTVALATSFAALQELPPGLMVLVESGVRTADEVVRLRDAGARGILVGESLLRADNVEAATRALMAGVR